MKNKNLILLEEYSNSIQASCWNNCSSSTYINNVSKFIRWYSKKYKKYLLENDNLKNIPEIVEEYRLQCKNYGNSKRTVINKTVAINSLFRWCVRKNKLDFNPIADKLEKIKFTDKDKIRESYFLNPKQINKIRNTMDRYDWDIQTKILFELFIDSACRISAVQSLKINNLRNNEFVDVIEKEGYLVNVHFFDRCKKLIDTWIDYRNKNNIKSEYLFITKYNEQYRNMSQSSIRSRIRKVGEIIGIENLYPHSLRKTIINMLYYEGGVEIASSYANHNDPRTTIKHYVSGIGSHNIDEITEIRKNLGI